LENLPQVFGKFTMKKTNFGKFTIFWEYFQGNRYYGKITMNIWNYALRWGRQVKIDPTFSGHGGQVARGVACLAKG
jgi:hypothetical protein